MRHIPISAAKDLAAGKKPPAVDGDLDFRSIRGAGKIAETPASALTHRLPE